MKVIELDGSSGEGGGQILRTALALSMITGTAFRIERIRARRAKPGLLRQHLTAVNASARICGAELDGTGLGSQRLEFAPGKIRGGDYQFAIGSAGSCTLVMQTVLPALWFADGPSTVSISGGTHNPAAPPADFLMRTWLPLMRRMGVDMDLELIRHGFYPAGGGELRAGVRPISALRPLSLQRRGELRASRATAIVAGVPRDVAMRELATLVECLRAELGEIEHDIRGLSSREGPGNALLLELVYGDASELFMSLGEKGLPAEAVATRLVREVRRYLQSGAPVGEYLADQLLLPLALAGAGSFRTAVLSSHLQTNLDVIERFLPVRIHPAEIEEVFQIDVSAR
jgi:RNA 3'-terminal phosphate cyclase (ATP)